MNATPFTPNFVGSLGRYPFFDYIDSKSNLNFQYSSNINFNYSNNSNSTSSNLSNVYYNFNSNNIITGSNVSNIYYNTGFIDSNLLWWRYELMGTQAELVVQKANQTLLSTQQTAMSATLSANSFTLVNHTGRLDAIDTKFNDYYNKTDTSNIFVSSNVLNFTSNQCYTTSSNNSFKNSSNFTYLTSNDVYTNSSNNSFKNSSNNTFSTSNDVYNNSSNNSFKNSSNFTYSTSNVINQNYYTKNQINSNITTQTLNVSSGYLGYSDSLFHVSNAICVRTTAPSGFYNDVNLTIGVGDPSLPVLIPFQNFNLPSNTGFSGIKFLRNGILHLTSSNSIVVNSVLNNVEINGSKIWLIGDVYTSYGTLAKKIPKYFTTSRTANFDGISCLAYDIDLTKISSKQTIDGIDNRHFRIKFFFASGRVDYQFAPRSFDVSLSTYNTLSVCSSDIWGVSSGLNKAFNSEYFLYKQNIDLITFCCPTAIFGTTNLKICYIIEDLIAQ